MAQVGIPTAADVAAALAARLPLAMRGAANGVASLDGSGKVPVAQLPATAITNVSPVANQDEMLALVVEVGDVAIRADGAGSFILRAEPASVLANWSLLTTRPLASADITDAAAPATANVVVKRDANGVSAFSQVQLTAAAPTAVNHATRKDYVDAQVVAARQRPTNNIAGPYTLQAADAPRLVRLTSATAVNLTVPAGVLPVGTVIEVAQGGAGAVTVVAGTGVTLTSRTGLVLAGLGARVTLLQFAADQWYVSGDLLNDTGQLQVAPLLTAGWAPGGDGASYRLLNGVVSVSTHLVRASGGSYTGGAIFTLPVGFRPAQMQWPVALKFGAVIFEWKITPAGVVSAGITIEQGSGMVGSTTFPAA